MTLKSGSWGGPQRPPAPAPPLLASGSLVSHAGQSSLSAPIFPTFPYRLPGFLDTMGMTDQKQNSLVTVRFHI